METYVEKDFLCNDTDTVVEIESGKVKGYRYDGVNTFLGIPYAKAKRFMSPEKPDKWEGIRDAFSYGRVCPLLVEMRPWNNLMNPNRQYPQGEACQTLNLWSASLDQSAKLPVIVWIHGGAFSEGSAIEQICYDGANTAKYGNAVFVSLNHRLNILGYFDVSSYGGEYKNSGNVGMEDIVFALQWIRDNITAFGGDPECVTIIGQSGGGGKVTTLLQIPAADGLFHRAVVMSGAKVEYKPNQRHDREIAELLFRELGIQDGDIRALQAVPTREFMAAAKKATSQVFTRESVAKKGRPFLEVEMNEVWEPLANGYYQGDIAQAGLTEHAKKVPVMLGSVFAEFFMRGNMKNKRHATEEEQIEHVRRYFGEDTDKLLPLFKEAYPDKCIADLAVIDSKFRPSIIAYSDIRAKAGGDTYVYLNASEVPVDDGLPLWHCSDIYFFFHNSELGAIYQKPGVTSRLENQIFGAFMQFARTGDPNGEGLARWPKYRKGDEKILYINDVAQEKGNFDKELVRLADMYRKEIPQPNPEE